MYQNFEVEESKENSKQNDINNLQNQQLQPYYPDYLEPEHRGIRLPYHIRLWRNRCIIALVLQAVASSSGFIMYTIRKMRVGQVVNVMCLLLIIFFGRGGVLTLNKMHIAVHGVITSSVFSVVFLYSILEILFLRNEEDQSSEKLMLFIFCLPYVADLICGIFCLYLAVILYEAQKQEVKLDIPQVSDSQLCAICISKQINTVFYPCGHKASCYECSLKIKQSYKMECPFCRQAIKDLIIVYDP
ncbi:hypothetical protein ABPG72_017109 [Tetrahymena utriculariae]